MKLVFERSVPGRGMQYLPACDVEEVAMPASLQRVILVKYLLKLGLHHALECEVFGKSFEFIFSHFYALFLGIKVYSCCHHPFYWMFGCDGYLVLSFMA